MCCHMPSGATSRFVSINNTWMCFEKQPVSHHPQCLLDHIADDPATMPAPGRTVGNLIEEVA